MAPTMIPDLKSPQEVNPSDTLRAFLDRTKKGFIDAAHSGRGREWAVVMGNEAGDLDSLACAIAFAWYLSEIRQSLAVALVQTPRGDLDLRAENGYALQLAGVGPDEPLCIDDVLTSAAPSSPFPSTAFALVDHNRLGTPFSADNPDARVVAIIDHHADEGLYTNADPRVVTPGVGSCSSLVATFLQEMCADKVPPELAMLLLSAIIIDTGGMHPGGKAIDVDRRAAAFLASRCTLAHGDVSSSLASSSLDAIPPLHESPVIQQLNATLQTTKASVAHLGTRDLLRRDYKEYALTPAFAPGRELLIGLASVPLALAAFVPRDTGEFVRDATSWMDERGLSALGVLTSFRDEKKAGKSG
ncbi:DHH phosphoesterase, partial [Daedalea quercina L-15889]